MEQAICGRQEDVEEDLKSGRPCTLMTDANIEKVRQLVCNDRHLTICVIANKDAMHEEMVRTILVDTLGMRKICAKIVPRLLTEEQKVQRLNAETSFNSWKQTTNSWKMSSQETGQGVFQYDLERT